MAKLIPITATPAPERSLDAVFVHGLGGDPLTTWLSGDDESFSWSRSVVQTCNGEAQVSAAALSQPV
ncbi:MAG: hypothetical protein FJ083_09400 [Cyanobacteria bacterium K_Offshore_surface_m2_239]|nr:hypothetical protein [Cyanobacteria bacterium K_Offshore_surface_m2_239]